VVKALLTEGDCFTLAFGVAAIFERGLTIFTLFSVTLCDKEERKAILDILGFAGAVLGHFKFELKNNNIDKPCHLKSSTTQDFKSNHIRILDTVESRGQICVEVT